ncbi:MAG: DUF4870 domain-containing protein [Bacteroidetes bacterium]|nr:DUF4870 domain-containing protein [Bacteroidota bacterium]
METTKQTQTAAFINLSTLTQYFIPLGNFIFPIIIWGANKDKSEYVEQQAKQTLNFQLSLFMYSCILALIAVPIFLVTFFNHAHFNAHLEDGDFTFTDFDFSDLNGWLTLGILAVLVFAMLKVAEFFLIIYASVKTANGDDFKYPFTINFLK